MTGAWCVWRWHASPGVWVEVAQEMTRADAEELAQRITSHGTPGLALLNGREPTEAPVS